ncbi:HPr family phosphocarrier protein [Anaerobium acetethylicum]|uniref:Phosphocarrier protein n=1 Tax=Anaerobium acetethylicum TaxID=1619234 RepID=A0A1D3TTJ7_9FIRM|nr:HPr family phosphocarrier protein [Anaerobium acetethylicum]SCP97278.1 phosphocarrier protein [Anaerobium acetethylicum]
MQEVRHVINDELGLHARPAGLLVKTAGAFGCMIKVRNAAKEVDAKRIMGVMGLGAKQGDEVMFTFEGEDEVDAAETVAKFLQENL